MDHFEIVSEHRPRGDQPAAIEKLVAGYRSGVNAQCLLGVTGSGKTFTMANVICQLNKPALIISHNKTLAAQLYEEFRGLLPNNAVEYFVSYYDYYQPEAYIPQRDIYIEKDASRNDDLDRLRLSTTSTLVTRADAVIVASVSCIFGLGSPEDYKNSVIVLSQGQLVDRDELLKRFVDLQYTRNDLELSRRHFRVRGDVIELCPAHEQVSYRIEMFGDEIEKLEVFDTLTSDTLGKPDKLFIFPAVHYVIPEERIAEATANIMAELDQRVMEFRRFGKLLEAQRLLARTKYDVEMLREVGYCSGIENYSRHLNGFEPGAKPYTLIDYFPEGFLLIIDESHASLPQIRAMFNGDQARKKTLVEHGFRLPSCLDNRPLRFEEFEAMCKKVLYVSATPALYELTRCGGEVVEQIIRPTGLVDPDIEVRPARGQVPDLLQGIAQRAAAGERVLVTTLTKRLAEELASYIEREGLRGRYMHSDIDTLDRVTILRELREGKFDCLVGVNLLREGLDLPEVSLVAILDADKEGFLRSETSLVQMIGRTARNVNAQVILYADKITGSMQRAMDETSRRQTIQLAYNEEHNITPETIRKEIRSSLESQVKSHKIAAEAASLSENQLDRAELIGALEKDMFDAAEALEFEKAARLRDRLKELKNLPELTVDSKIKKDQARKTSKKKTKRAAKRHR